MPVRTAVFSDLPALAAAEALCFPPAEAASEADLAARLRVYPNHFWLLEEDGSLISFINGLVTDIPQLQDAMYADPSFHRENGAWQMIFGVNTLPQYRRQGRAAQVMKRVIDDAHAQGRKGCVLTCKDALIPYYARFGFQNEGISASSHGGAVWYSMRLTFQPTAGTNINESAR